MNDTPTLKPKMFPVMVGPPGHKVYVPWELISPHEDQAKRNHCGQSFEELAERGGLSARETAAVMSGFSLFDRPRPAMRSDREAWDIIWRCAAEFHGSMGWADFQEAKPEGNDK